MRAVGSLLLCFALAACSAQSPLGGAPNPRLTGATDLGRIAPGTELDFVLGLQLARPARLGKFLADQPFTRDFVTPGDFADAFAVSDSMYRQLLGWLAAHDLHVTRTSAGRTAVSVHATARAIEAAFGTELHDYVDVDGRFQAAIGSLQMSPEIVNVVGGVVGLDGAPPWVSHRVTAGPALPQAGGAGGGTGGCGGGITAANLQALYGYGNTASPGQNETVVILGAGIGPDPTKDVAAYVTAMGLPTSVATQYMPILVDGPNRDPGQDTSPDSEYGENCLDVDMVFAMAPLANVAHVITATNTPGLFTDGISLIVNDATLSKAHAVSVSYGGCERGSAGEMPIINALLAQAQAEGQQWFFAAGDSATDGCRNGMGNKIISAGWPGSSPYAVSVGGSSVGATPGTISVGTVETPWDLGGGAPSESFEKPAFQSNVGASASDGARDTPDVAAMADPTPGVCTVVGGQLTPGTGGTSAAAPIWAGVWAVLHQNAASKSGAGPAFSDALTTLYTIGKGVKAGAISTSALKDISTGSIRGPNGGTTGGYAAATGYDLASGWGTPNLTQLIAVWP
jgi:kumamolisin